MAKEIDQKGAKPSREDEYPEIDELKRALEGLEADVDTLQENIDTLSKEERRLKTNKVSDRREPPLKVRTRSTKQKEREQAFTLEDPENTTRQEPRQSLPRPVPSPLFREIGGTATAPEVEIDAEAKPTRPPSNENKRPKISAKERRAKKKEKRQALAAARAKKLAEKQEATEQEKEASDTSGMDDLELENPLPDAAYSPERDHTHLVLDRRQRRVEAALRAEMMKPEESAWESEEVLPEELLSPDRRFSLPIYLVKAALVTIAGFLVVSGIRTAILGTQSADDGQEPLPDAYTPGLSAVGIVEAEETLTAFLKAKTLDEMVQFVRRPDTARTRMEAFYATNPLQSYPNTGIIERAYNSLEGGEGILFTCETSRGEKIKVPLVRIPDEAPYYVVDWEVYVNYADVDWAEFLSARKPGSVGVFRLYATEEDYFGWQFSDPEAYLCMLLYGIERENSAFAYVDLATQDSREIQAVMRLHERREAKRRGPRLETKAWMPKDYTWSPMVLELRFPDEVPHSAVPQLEVVRYISPNWVVAKAE